MRIAITADPYLPVPPLQYGGIERVVDFVVRGLVTRGHDVTLFAHPESHTAGRLVPYGQPPHSGSAARTRELWQLATRVAQRAGHVDAVLSWGRLAALAPVLPMRRLAKVQRYCRHGVPFRSTRLAALVAGSSVRFAAPTASVFEAGALSDTARRRWEVVPDGVEVARYQPSSAVGKGAPLAFIGKLVRYKGPHIAIEIARRASAKLIVAGNPTDEPDGHEYFERVLKPQFDGRQIEYVGPVDDTQKNSLLRECSALLFTSLYPEPFGLVMVEAMACGTPVIAMANGSVPEIVRQGVTGFVCRSVGEAVDAVAHLSRLDRVAVRAECEQRFSDSVVVDSFEQLLRRMVHQCRGA
ncbi:MAG TPA: glycosyltransferase family 4 protein [Thermoanaerobaculaceae bacterium]|nr:glycosyltransferase family 4 protein [Thermoanaerobaculaceae bacterium]